MGPELLLCSQPRNQSHDSPVQRHDQTTPQPAVIQDVDEVSAAWTSYGPHKLMSYHGPQLVDYVPIPCIQPPALSQQAKQALLRALMHARDQHTPFAH